MKVIDEADVVVVGTGAGGATAAVTLARAGHEVLMVEEGPDLRGRPTEPTLRDAMLGRFRGVVGQLSGGDLQVPVLQGRCVGGSTAINSAIYWRLPESIWKGWADADAALGRELPYERLCEASESLERDLHVRPVADEVMGQNSRLMQLGTQRLGLDGSVIQRMEVGCEGTARCNVGCPSRRRMGMEVAFVPETLSRRGRLLVGSRAMRVRLRAGTAEGVEIAEGFLRARKSVVVAAGAVHTPWLLHRSGIRGVVGRRFTAHPGFSMEGLMGEKVQMGFGATQGFQSRALAHKGMKFESLGLPPALALARLPGAGENYRRWTEQFDHLACWACLIRPERHGDIGFGPFGPRPRLAFGQGDVARVLEGLKTLARIFFAAGAKVVFPGIAGGPPAITSEAEIDCLELSSADRLTMLATHLFGGAVMGSDPRHSVVDPHLRVHGSKNLYAMDASVLPTSLGVNPQGTIMAVVRAAAEAMA